MKNEVINLEEKSWLCYRKNAIRTSGHLKQDTRTERHFKTFGTIIRETTVIHENVPFQCVTCGTLWGCYCENLIQFQTVLFYFHAL